MPEERGLYPKTKVGPQLEYLARLHGLSTAAPRAAAHEWTDRLGIAERYDDNVAELRTRDGQFLDVAGPEPASRLADGLPGVLAADYGADCTRLHR